MKNRRINKAEPPRLINHKNRRGWLFRPEGSAITKPVDVFFLYPTVYVHPGKKRHNLNPYHLIYRFFAWFLTVWRGKVFSDACNIYTPHYRQAGIEILDMPQEEARQYIDIAYQDVSNAFNYYIENLNGGRPFILAGHSQGSEQILELMKREFTDGKYADKFLGAYIIGFSVTKEDLEEYPQLRLAKSGDDLGSIVTYNTSAKGLKLMKVVKPGAVAVNPLAMNTNPEYVSKARNLGSVLFEFGRRLKVERRAFTGAYIDEENGVIIIDSDALNELFHIKVGFLNKILLRRGTLHMLDIALFHRNLQANVRKRIEKYYELNGAHSEHKGELYAIVRKTLNKYDLMKLISAGGGKKEYDAAARLISVRISHLPAEEKISATIKEVIKEIFEVEPNPEQCTAVTREILERAAQASKRKLK